MDTAPVLLPLLSTAPLLPSTSASVLSVGLFLGTIGLPLLGAVLSLRRPPGARRALLPLALTLLCALAATASTALGGPLRITPWRLLDVETLHAELALVATPLAAGLGALTAAVFLFATRAAVRTPTDDPDEPRHASALLHATCAATMLTLFADNWLVVLVGWELLALLSLVLPKELPIEPARPAAGTLGRAADLLLLVAVALLFWSLGGSWAAAGRGFVPDFDPSLPLPTLSGPTGSFSLGPTLSLTELALQLQLTDASGGHPVVLALHNKLLLGRPLVAALRVAFGLAGLFKLGAGLCLFAQARSPRPRALALAAGFSSLLVGAHLLFRMRWVLF